jgi:hypothetical protein
LCTLLSCRAAFPAGEPVELRRQGDHVDVLIGEKLFTTYYFSSEVAKPYFQPLRSAQGTIVTRDFPSGNTIPPDHLNDRALEPNQRPLCFGHGNIDGLDFWGEAAFPRWGSYKPTPGSVDSVFGRVTFRTLLESRSGSDSSSLRAVFELMTPHRRAIADEIQSFIFGGDPNTRWIDCEYILIADHGSDVTMGDSKEGTFAVRVAPDLSLPSGNMVNSAGAKGEKAIWGKRADWVDFDGTVAGEKLGVAVFDSPRSFRHPTYWHARAYGLLAANPLGWREFNNDPDQDGSWTIQQGRPLKFRYRVFIHHGDYKQARITDAYQEYAASELR